MLSGLRPGKSLLINRHCGSDCMVYPTKELNNPTCSRSATCSGSAPYLLPSGHLAPGSSARIRSTPDAPGCMRAIFFSSDTVSKVVRSTLDAAAMRKSRGLLQQLARMILSGEMPKLSTVSICKGTVRCYRILRCAKLCARMTRCQLEAVSRTCIKNLSSRKCIHAGKLQLWPCHEQHAVLLG